MYYITLLELGIHNVRMLKSPRSFKHIYLGVMIYKDLICYQIKLMCKHWHWRTSLNIYRAYQLQSMLIITNFLMLL